MNSKQNINSYKRFKDLSWFGSISQSNIMILGQGGLGSWLTLFLAKTGANLFTVDFDTVEESNIAGQCYGISHVGSHKTVATMEVIKYLCGENNITPIIEEITDNEKQQWYSHLPKCDVVCATFDSIAARKIAYFQWKKVGKKDSLWVDIRMSAEQGQVFTLSKEANEDKIDYYEGSFFSDADIPELPCTAKATTHCGSLFASLAVGQITNWFSNKTSTNMKRVVKDKTEYYIPINLFTSNNAI